MAEISDGQLRWGILGTASISVEIIKAIQSSGCCKIGAIASRDLLKAKEWAKRHGIPLSFGSYDDLLRSGEVDLIYNPLPNSLHAEWTIKALETGHSVLCEKPLAANVQEALAIAEAAAKTGLHVAEAFMYRFHPQWTKVFDLLQRGVIGNITSLHSQFTFMLDDRSENPASKELAGGALMDVGCYCVNSSRLIAGCEPTWVSALERRTSVDDLMVCLLEFPNGILAHFETSIANYERHRVEIAGIEGSILLNKPWIPADEPANIMIYRQNSEPRKLIIPSANSYRLEIEEFVDVCNRKIQPRWPISDAVANMVVIDALYASARERRVIKLE